MSKLFLVLIEPKQRLNMTVPERRNDLRSFTVRHLVRIQPVQNEWAVELELPTGIDSTLGLHKLGRFVKFRNGGKRSRVVSLRGIGIDPLDDKLDLFLRECLIIPEIAES